MSDAPRDTPQPGHTGGDLPDWARDPDTLEAIVLGALHASDMDGVEAALRFLALADPTRAEQIVTVMKAGLILAAEARR